MNIPKTILSAVLIIVCFSASSQDTHVTPFRDDLNKKDIKIILKAVADWQIRTPLTHHTADWTNAAMYAGMVQWAGIAGNELYFEWLKRKAEENSWSYKKPDDPRGRYHAYDYSGLRHQTSDFGLRTSYNRS